MSKNISKLLCLLTVLSCSAVFFHFIPGAAAASQPLSDYYKPVAPSAEHYRTVKLVVDQLMYKHYRQLDFDDALSAKIFDQYLADLDRNHLYFLADDIREFEKYRFRFDDLLREGDLGPAFEIFNRCQERIVERLLSLLDRIDSEVAGFDFGIDEYLETDREGAPWASTPAELDELWRKRLKASVLELKLAGKSMDEIKQTLERRFRNQLNRAGMARSEDGFQVYVNAVSSLFDPHTQYLSPRSSENFNINMKLSLEGIGAMLRLEDEYVQIVRLITGGPADKDGQLKPADRIVGVGQGKTGEIVDVVGWRLDDVVELIRGEKGTEVRLAVLPAEAKDESGTKIISIVRNTVNLEEQSAQKKIFNLERGEQVHKIGILQIPAFYADFDAIRSQSKDYRSTTNDVRRLLAELAEEKVEGIIVDLRDNGGGSLQEANMLTGLFIKKGPTVQIRSTSGRTDVMDDPDPEIVYNGPLVVLVNRLSASASEIFSGAVQDYGRGIVVGEQTFGKGTVQSLRSLNSGQFKITAAKFYRVSGGSTQHKGIVPDLAYPSLYDSEKIGESALENALPWDTIPPAAFRSYNSELPSLIPQLAEREQRRLDSDADYRYLNERITHLREIRQLKKVSLNEAVRRKEKEEEEQWRLRVENTLRAVKKQSLLQSVQELDDKAAEKDLMQPHVDEHDPLFMESGQVLLDLLELSGQTAALAK